MSSLAAKDGNYASGVLRLRSSCIRASLKEYDFSQCCANSASSLSISAENTEPEDKVTLGFTRNTKKIYTNL